MEAMKQQWQQQMERIKLQTAAKEDEATRLKDESEYNASIVARLHRGGGATDKREGGGGGGTWRRRVEHEERERRKEEDRRREVELLEKAKWDMKVGQAEEDRDRWKKEAAHHKREAAHGGRKSAATKQRWASKKRMRTSGQQCAANDYKQKWRSGRSE